jgi:hypothetical protein
MHGEEHLSSAVDFSSAMHNAHNNDTTLSLCYNKAAPEDMSEQGVKH